MNQKETHQTTDQSFQDNRNDYPSSVYMQDTPPINLKKYFFIFIKHWYLFLITLGIALSIAFFKARYKVPEYLASATLILEDEDSNQDVLGQFRAARYWRRQSDMTNERAKISSFTNIKRTVDSLPQEVFWTAHGRIRVRPLYNNPRFQLAVFKDSTDWYEDLKWHIDYIDNNTCRLYRENYLDTILQLNSVININKWRFSIKLVPGGSGHLSYSFVINNPITLTKQYKAKLQIEIDEKEGSVINLKSGGPVGEREVDFLNTLSRIYIISGLERKQEIADNASVFIENQMKVILDSLNKAENQLLKFRLSNNVINLSKDGEIAYEQLQTFHAQRTQLKLEENYYHYLHDYIEKRNDPQTIITPTLTDDGDRLLIAAVQELQMLYEERENMDISLMTNNPSLENINVRIKFVRLRILEIIKGLIENNRLTQDQIDIEEQSIVDQLKTLPLNEQQLLNIKRKYDLYNQFYTFLLEKRAEAGIEKASTISNIKILDPARYDQLTTVGSDKKIVFLIAFFLGLFVPSSILVLITLIDTRIHDRDDIINQSNIPIIGIIGHASDSTILPSNKELNSSFTEALRRIRSNLAFTLRGSKKRVILITSSVSGEGKTFTAANLAAIIALNNKKVLLVGCDLRKPTLHKIFNLSNDIGITSVIMGENKLEEVITLTNIENLYLLPSGPIPPNPAELIETNEMQNIFDKITIDYDYVLIDTPPIALVADGLSLAHYADLTLYLVRQNFSRKDVLEIANTIKTEGKLPNPYLLINDFRASRSLGMNYYYGYGKGYTYGNKYYEDSSSSS